MFRSRDRGSKKKHSCSESARDKFGNACTTKCARTLPTEAQPQLVDAGRPPEGNKSHTTIKGLWSFGVHTSTRGENATISSNSEHRRGWWESGMSAEKRWVFLPRGGTNCCCSGFFSAQQPVHRCNLIRGVRVPADARRVKRELPMFRKPFFSLLRGGRGRKEARCSALSAVLSCCWRR